MPAPCRVAVKVRRPEAGQERRPAAGNTNRPSAPAVTSPSHSAPLAVFGFPARGPRLHGVGVRSGRVGSATPLALPVEASYSSVSG